MFTDRKRKNKEETQTGELRQRTEGETGGRGRWREEKQTERAHRGLSLCS